MPPHLHKQVHQYVYNWYQEHGRVSLPWRNTNDPYAIYVSEVMLQQTQVQTVLERYYFPFLEKFPSLTHLAAATEQEVLKAWQGLGYYSRAINLHKTAKLLQGSLPSSVEALIALPGIGKNTAHAIAAFGFHNTVPVLEANVKRILYRVFALEEASEKLLWEKAHALLDENHPFEYNQAMMDIGSLICTKSNPVCHQCPLSLLCRGKDNPEYYPVKKVKKTIPIVQKKIIIFSDANNRIFMTPRASRFLYGLYGFCEYEQGADIIFQGKDYTKELLYYLGHISQSYSHFTLEAEIYSHTLEFSANSAEWKERSEISTLPLSKADSKVFALITDSS